MLGHFYATLPFYLAIGGLFVAWFIYMKRPEWAEKIKGLFAPVYALLDKKYFFDEIYQFVFAGGSRGIGKFFWSKGDQKLIDEIIINGSANNVGRFAAMIRNIQTGYLFHYAIAMIMGLLALLTWFVII
jgi:NADH-quinone oxidoreductase subunit L